MQTLESGKNLYAAQAQWMNRPDDERFWNLQEMLEETNGYRRRSTEKQVDLSTMRVDVNNGTPRLISAAAIAQGRVGVEFTHYSFGQFCSLMRAPSSYMRALPADLVADNLNHSIARRMENPDVDDSLKALVYLNREEDQERMFLRAMTSSKYSRIWNSEIVQLAIRFFEQRGWKVPPARPHNDSVSRFRYATEEDCLQSRKHGIPVKPGDKIAPAGLYASDHDCFIFMVNEERPVTLPNGEQLFRGVFLKNSEVGDASLTCFYYEGVCGNHIVWNSRDVKEIRLRHVGAKMMTAFNMKMRDITRGFIDVPATEHLEVFRAAMSKVIDKDPQKIHETLNQKKILTLDDSKRAYNIAVSNASTHGDPKTVWGMVSGVTRLSQLTQFSDDRESLDRAAQKILSLAL